MRVKHHLTPQEIQRKIIDSKEDFICRRWLVILYAMECPEATKEEIAENYLISPWTVRNIIHNYNRNGARSVETIGMPKPVLMKIDEEIQFFEEIKKPGQWLLPECVHSELKKRGYKNVKRWDIYNMLQRHYARQRERKRETHDNYPNKFN